MSAILQLKRFVPPVLWDMARWTRRHVLRPSRPEWEYLPQGWASRDEKIKGWDVESIVRTQMGKWPSFLRALEGAAPLGVAHEANEITNDLLPAHNILLSYGYVLLRAALKRDRVSVLDWGGGIGHYYIISKALLDDKVALDYAIKDVPTLCRGGRALLPDVTFYDNDDSALATSYDLVFASTSLQYAVEWRDALGRLAKSARHYLYVTNIPIVEKAPSFVVVQRPYAYGYDTEYLGWFFNRQEVLECAASHGMRLVREFLVEARPAVYGAPEQGEYRGFLFERKPD